VFEHTLYSGITPDVLIVGSSKKDLSNVVSLVLAGSGQLLLCGVYRCGEGVA